MLRRSTACGSVVRRLLRAELHRSRTFSAARYAASRGFSEFGHRAVSTSKRLPSATAWALPAVRRVAPRELPRASYTRPLTSLRRGISFTYSARIPCIRFGVSTERLARATEQPTLPANANLFLIDVRKSQRKTNRASPKSVMASIVAAHREEAQRAKEELDADDAYTPPLIFLVKSDDTKKQAARRQEQMNAQLDAIGAFGEFRVCVLDGIKSRHWIRYVDSAPSAAATAATPAKATTTAASAGSEYGASESAAPPAHVAPSEAAHASAAAGAGAVAAVAAGAAHAEPVTKAAAGARTTSAAAGDGTADAEGGGEEEEWEEVEVEVEEGEDEAEGEALAPATPALHDIAASPAATAAEASLDGEYAPTEASFASPTYVDGEAAAPEDALEAFEVEGVEAVDLSGSIAAAAVPTTTTMTSTTRATPARAAEVAAAEVAAAEEVDGEVEEESLDATPATPAPNQSSHARELAAKAPPHDAEPAPSLASSQDPAAAAGEAADELVEFDIDGPFAAGEGADTAPTPAAAPAAAPAPDAPTAVPSDAVPEEATAAPSFPSSAASATPAAAPEVRHIDEVVRHEAQAEASSRVASEPTEPSAQEAAAVLVETVASSTAPAPAAERKGVAASTSASPPASPQSTESHNAATAGAAAAAAATASPTAPHQEPATKDAAELEEKSPAAASPVAAAPPPPPPPPPEPSIALPAFPDIQARLYRGASTVHLSDRAFLELPATANVLVVDHLDWDDARLSDIDAALAQVDPVAGHVLLYLDAYAPQEAQTLGDVDAYRLALLPFVLVFRTMLSTPTALTLQHRFAKALHARPTLPDAAQQARVAGQNDRSSVCVLSGAETEKGGDNPLLAPQPRKPVRAAPVPRARARTRILERAARMQATSHDASAPSPTHVAPAPSASEALPAVAHKSAAPSAAGSSRARGTSSEAVQQLWDLLNSVTVGSAPTPAETAVGAAAAGSDPIPRAAVPQRHVGEGRQTHAAPEAEEDLDEEEGAPRSRRRGAAASSRPSLAERWGLQAGMSTSHDARRRRAAMESFASTPTPVTADTTTYGGTTSTAGYGVHDQTHGLEPPLTDSISPPHTRDVAVPDADDAEPRPSFSSLPDSPASAHISSTSADATSASASRRRRGSAPLRPDAPPTSWEGYEQELRSEREREREKQREDAGDAMRDGDSADAAAAAFDAGASRIRRGLFNFGAISFGKDRGYYEGEGAAGAVAALPVPRYRRTAQGAVDAGAGDGEAAGAASEPASGNGTSSFSTAEKDEAEEEARTAAIVAKIEDDMLRAQVRKIEREERRYEAREARRVAREQAKLAAASAKAPAVRGGAASSSSSSPPAKHPHRAAKLPVRGSSGSGSRKAGSSRESTTGETTVAPAAREREKAEDTMLEDFVSAMFTDHLDKTGASKAASSSANANRLGLGGGGGSGAVRSAHSALKKAAAAPSSSFGSHRRSRSV